MLEQLDAARLRRDEDGLGARPHHRVPRFDKLGALHALIGDEERDASRHARRPL